MCVAIALFDREFPLVLAFNRDEAFTRETLPCHRWGEDDLIAGRDAVHNGTWLAASPAHGRVALLTNLDSKLLYGANSRKGLAANPGRLSSRGSLVVEAARYGSKFLDTVDYSRYMPFQMITVDVTNRRCYYTNRRTTLCERPTDLVVSNFDPLGVSPAEMTPKSIKARQEMLRLRDDGRLSGCDIDEFPFDDIFRIMSETSPTTGCDITHARTSLCVDPLPVPGFSNERWGTRSISIVGVHRCGRGIFVEYNRDTERLVWNPPIQIRFDIACT